MSVLLAASPAFAVPTDNPRHSALDRSVDQAADAFFAHECHVGVSLVVQTADGRDHFYNYGSTSRERASRPTRDTLYEIGSLTKTFTGTLTSTAIEEGRMSLDGALTSYLHGDYPGLSYQGRAVEVRDIVTHTSALPQNVPDLSAVFSTAEQSPIVPRIIAAEASYDRAAYLEALTHVTLTRLPGERSEYSNYAPKILSFALEDVYGADLAHLLQQKITGPLGMRSTGFDVSDRRRLAIPYDATGQQPYHAANIGAAGGIYSNASDMARYLAYHLREDAVAKRTHEPLVTLGETISMSMFWYVDRVDHRVWQSGGLFGMSSQMVFWPEEHVGVVLLANDGCRDTQGQLFEWGAAIRTSLKTPAAQ
ncbi:MAG: serine hydrolase domain-containing protein [Pseudomonadota bacterium]